MAGAQTIVARATEMPGLELPGDMPLVEVTNTAPVGEIPGGDMATAAAEEAPEMPAGEIPAGETAAAEETGEMPAGEMPAGETAAAEETGEMPAGEMGEGAASGKASVVDVSGTWQLVLAVTSIGGSRQT